jgi:hypothetical protein
LGAYFRGRLLEGFWWGPKKIGGRKNEEEAPSETRREKIRKRNSQLLSSLFFFRWGKCQFLVKNSKIGFIWWKVLAL